jgi:hypothetical protein
MSGSTWMHTPTLHEVSQLLSRLDHSALRARQCGLSFAWCCGSWLFLFTWWLEANPNSPEIVPPNAGSRRGPSRPTPSMLAVRERTRRCRSSLRKRGYPSSFWRVVLCLARWVRSRTSDGCAESTATIRSRDHSGLAATVPSGRPALECSSARKGTLTEAG